MLTDSGPGGEPPPARAGHGNCTVTSEEGGLDPRVLAKAGLGEVALAAMGLRPKEMGRIWRAMFVYSAGFHNCVSEIVADARVPGSARLVSRIWRTYSLLMEKSGKQHGGGGGAGMGAVERDHQDELAAKAEAHEAELEQLRETVSAGEAALAQAGERFAALERKLSARQADVLALELRLGEQEEATMQEQFQRKRANNEAMRVRAAIDKVGGQIQQDAAQMRGVHEELTATKAELADREGEANRAQSELKRIMEVVHDAQAHQAQLATQLKAQADGRQQAERGLEAKSEKLRGLEQEQARLQAALGVQTACKEVVAEQLVQARRETTLRHVELRASLQQVDLVRAERDAAVQERVAALSSKSVLDRALEALRLEHGALVQSHAASESAAEVVRRQAAALAQEAAAGRADLAAAVAAVEGLRAKVAETAGALARERDLRKLAQANADKYAAELAKTVDNLALVKSLLIEKAEMLTVTKAVVAELEAKLSTAETKLHGVESRLEGVESRLEGAEMELEGAKGAGRAEEALVAELQAKLKGAEAKIKMGGSEAKLEDAEANLQGAEAKLEGAEAKLKDAEAKLEGGEGGETQEGGEAQLEGTEAKASKLEKAEAKLKLAEQEPSQAQENCAEEVCAGVGELFGSEERSPQRVLELVRSCKGRGDSLAQRLTESGLLVAEIEKERDGLLTDVDRLQAKLLELQSAPSSAEVV